MSEHTESGFLNCGGSNRWTDRDHSGIDGLYDGSTHRSVTIVTFGLTHRMKDIK